MSTRTIKNKNVFLVYFFSIITFGIYWTVWTVKSKRDMNALGADIPTSWLLIVPIANFYYMYKYCEGFSETVKKDNHTVLWCVVSFFAGIFMPFFVQTELNKHATQPPASVDANENIKIAA